MNFFKNNQGFSLVEVMVAAGMLGLLAMAGVKLMQNQNQAMKTIETKSEYNGIMNDIRTILADSNSCRTTLGGLNAKTTPVGAIWQITQVVQTGAGPTNIARYTGNANWQQAPAYGNGKIRIVGIRLDDSATDVETTSGPGPTVGTTNLVITFTAGLNTQSKQLETFDKNLKLNVTTTAGTTNINDCNSTVADNSLNDMTKACASLNGTYNQATERCILVSHPSTPANFSAVSTQYLADWAAAWKIATLDPEYVNVTGDTMTGVLTMQSDIVMSGTQIQFNSDRKLKKDIQDLKDTLVKIRRMSPKVYKWKANDKVHMGLIAQELAPLYPELVKKSPEGTLNVDYIQLTPVLIKGVQDIDKENRKLKTELDFMRAELCKDNPAFKFCKR